MIKRAAIATTFTLLALTGAGAAAFENGAPQTISPADQCVWNYFNDTAANYKHLPGEYTRNYPIEELHALAAACEKDTGTRADFFSGIESFSKTIDNVTLKFGK